MLLRTRCGGRRRLIAGRRRTTMRAILAVHDAALVEHLATVWAEWEAAGYPAEHGRRRVVPYLFPTAGLLGGLPAALAGRRCTGAPAGTATTR